MLIAFVRLYPAGTPSEVTPPPYRVLALVVSPVKVSLKRLYHFLAFFFRGSLSTVVGDLSLTSRENQIGSLYFDVQSDENFCFKVLEVSKAESLTLNVLDEFVSGF